MSVKADRWLARGEPALVVVNYHRIHASAGNATTAFDDGVFGPDVRTFRRQMEWLKAATVVLGEAEIVALDEEARPAGHTIYSAVTFDDAYIDCFELVKPVLDELGIQGIFFVPFGMIESRSLGWWDQSAYLLKRTTRRVLTLNGRQFDLSVGIAQTLKQILTMFKLEKADRTSNLLQALAEACGVALPSKDEQSAQLMTWQQIRSLKAAGHAIGSHSISHRVLATLGREEQEAEIRGSKRELEAVLGSGVASFAYPVGGPAHFDRHSVELVQAAGYAQAFTFNTGIAALPLRNRFTIPRESANTPSILEAKVRVPGVMGVRLG